MLKMMLATALLVSPVSAAERWAIDPECAQPMIYIDDEIIERLDFQCLIESVEKAGSATVYNAECQTDAPSVEPMKVTVQEIGAGNAEITWDRVDAGTYYRCD